MMWRDRYRTFGENCIRNHRSLRPHAVKLGTETSLDLQACLTLIVILNESFEREDRERLIKKKDVTEAILRCIDPSRKARNARLPPQDARVDSLRHALAHFNVTPDASGPNGQGVIVGLFLQSKPKSEKPWKAYIQAKKLRDLIDELANLWPAS